jgi:dTDP-4-dehydrorhamnose reductase
MNKVLILGAKGMLGGALQKQLPDCIAWDREDCDVADFENCKLKILNLTSLEAVVNCVAYNDVDGAETHKDLAFLLNAEVPKQLAKICHQLNIPLVHFTSQLVFDGAKGGYQETDLPHPISLYGESKYQGEQNIQNQTDKFYIIRTSVLFGPKGRSELSKTSFVDLMLDLSLKHATIKVVDDEQSSVTFVDDLAANVKEILQNKPTFGIYHITNSGSATWYGLAKEIFTITGRLVELAAVPASEFPRPARRPAKAVLVNTKLPPLRPWEEALKEFLKSKI